MRKILFATALAVLSQFGTSAQALELKFKFKVNSSGPIMYACNAGLKHQDPGNKVCYSQGTMTPCDPTSCTPGNQCNPKCLCSSGNGGAYRMDFFKANYGSFLANSPLPTKVVKAAGTTDYVRLFTDKDAWGTRIEELEFNLGSERYGAKYFVDICFHGAQIEYFENQVNAPNAFYAEVLETDLNANATLSYRTLSGLAYGAEWVCDLQGSGAYVYARNNSDQYDSLDNEANFGGGDVRGSVTNTSATANTKTLFNTYINTDSRSPRFCKIRYYFEETALNALRKWQRHDAQMCTFTRIEEDLGASPQN